MSSVNSPPLLGSDIFLHFNFSSIFRHTGKNNRFPFLDILGYLKNTHKIPNLAKWDKSQPSNSQPSSLVGTCLTLPNSGFSWVFFKYPKISKNGKYYLLFFLWQHWNFIIPGLPFRTFCNMWNLQDSSQKHVYTDILHNLVSSCWKVVISLSANPMYLKVVLHVR